MKVDVRVLSATRRDLDREVQAGRFRDDLYHRLVVTRVELPALRKRRGDIAVLARHFAQALGGDDVTIPDAVIARWESARWPGNVRELRNAVARQLAIGDLVYGDGLDATEDDLPEASLDQPSPVGSETSTLDDAIVSRLLAERALTRRRSAEAPRVVRPRVSRTHARGARRQRDARSRGVGASPAQLPTAPQSLQALT